MAQFFFRIDDLLPPFRRFDHVTSRIKGGRALPIHARTSRFLWFLEGKADFFCGDSPPVRIEPGSAMVFPAPCNYHYLSVPRNAAIELRAIRLVLDGDAAVWKAADPLSAEIGELMKLFTQPFTLIPETFLSDVLPLVRRIEALAGQEGQSRRAMASGLCLQLVATMARLCGSPREPGKSATGSAAGLHLCEQFIIHHLAETIPLERIANHVGWSREHLSRRFHEERGETIGAFIRARRVDLAKEMLARQGRNLEQIARTCGFADAAHLGRVFKENTGLSPGAFRQGLIGKSIHDPHRLERTPRG